MAVSHLAAMFIFALLVSVVFGVLEKGAPREQAIYGAKTFGAFVGIGLVMGWVMYLFAR